VGGVNGEGDPLSDQTEWVLDRIVELFPGSKAGFEPLIAQSMIIEAIRALEGVSGLTLFGLAHSSIDPSKVEQILALLEEALAAWRALDNGHDPAFVDLGDDPGAKHSRDA